MPFFKGMKQSNTGRTWFKKGQTAWNKEIPLSGEHRKNIRKANKGKHNSPETEFRKGRKAWNKDKKLSVSHIENLRKSHRGKKISKKTKIKMRESHINNPNKKFKDTSIELKIESELQRRSIYYQKQIPLCNIAIVDFYLPEHRIVIQCDGCFYHGCPIHNPDWIKSKERDTRQDKVLTFNGFNVYRFWQHEINESPERCIDKLLINRVG